MNLDIIEKHVHLTPLANGNIEVMFSGQPCLNVQESYDGGFSWKINPLFAKLTYGANIFEDVPYCYSSLDTVEEAIASGLSSLNDLGAFHGVIDLPTDTYVEEHLDESLDEAVTHKELLAGAQKAYIEATRQGNGVMARKYGADILKHKANIAKQMAAAKQKNESEEQIDEREDREDDEGYARTKKSDDAYNASLTRKKAANPVQRKTPEQEKAEWDKWVKECITDDCRKEALKHSDSIMEAHDLARGLLESVMEDLDEGIVKSIKRGLQGWGGEQGTPREVANRAKKLNDKDIMSVRAAVNTPGQGLYGKGEFKNPNEHSPAGLQKRILDREMKKRGLSEVELNEISNEKKQEYLDKAVPTHQKQFLGRTAVPATKKQLDKRRASIQKVSKELTGKTHYQESVEELGEAEDNRWELYDNDPERKYQMHMIPRTKLKIGEKRFKHTLGKEVVYSHSKQYPDSMKARMNESIDEAALSGDAYWKAKEEAAKEAKAKEERASMGIKEPVKKGRGKPTNIDLEFVHAAAKKNLEAGKRPTTGMDRNEKIHFVRHLSKHPDFADHHVAKAGRPTGTTAVAKVEKEKVKKAETSAFSMWAGLGKK